MYTCVNISLTNLMLSNVWYNLYKVWEHAKLYCVLYVVYEHRHSTFKNMLTTNPGGNICPKHSSYSVPIATQVQRSNSLADLFLELKFCLPISCKQHCPDWWHNGGPQVLSAALGLRQKLGVIGRVVLSAWPCCHGICCRGPQAQLFLSTIHGIHQQAGPRSSRGPGRKWLTKKITERREVIGQIKSGGKSSVYRNVKPWKQAYVCVSDFLF